jgi:hypothetical protein
MKTIRKMLVTAAFAVMVAACIPMAKADLGDQATEVTINRPIQIGNMLLTPGSYILRLADIWAGDTVEVINAKTGNAAGIVMGEPAYRSHPADKSIFKLKEVAKGAPEALQYWYYPDTHYGIRFPVPQTKTAGMHYNAAHLAG